MTVKGYLKDSEITTPSKIIPVVLYNGTREEGEGWFLLDWRKFRYDYQWVVVTAVFEDEV